MQVDSLPTELPGKPERDWRGKQKVILKGRWVRKPSAFIEDKKEGDTAGGEVVGWIKQEIARNWSLKYNMILSRIESCREFEERLI